MTALPDLNVSGAVTGQIFKVNFGNNIINATLGQQYQDQSDVLLIYNLSPCNFQVTLTTTNRTFNLPSGVTSNPIPLSYRGTADTGLNLTVKSIIVAGTPNTVSFDWFRPGEPILAAPASSNPGVGSVTLTTLTTTQITFPPPTDNWTIAEDGSGNLVFTDTTTAQSYTMGRNATLVGGAFISDIEAGNTVIKTQPSTSTQNYIIQVNALNFSFFTDGSIGIPQRIASVNGQSTAGFQGVPLIIAQAINILVSTTALTTILTAAIPATGFYRLNVSFFSGNSVAVSPLIRVTYTGGNQSSSINDAMFSSTGNYLDGTHVISNGLDLACLAWTNFLKTGTNLLVIYQDNAGTPADRVTAILERLQ